MIKFLSKTKDMNIFFKKTRFDSKDLFSISSNIEIKERVVQLLLVDKYTFKSVTVEEYKYETIKNIIIIKKQD